MKRPALIFLVVIAFFAFVVYAFKSKILGWLGYGKKEEKVETKKEKIEEAKKVAPAPQPAPVAQAKTLEEVKKMAPPPSPPAPAKPVEAPTVKATSATVTAPPPKPTPSTTPSSTPQTNPTSLKDVKEKKEYRYGVFQQYVYRFRTPDGKEVITLADPRNLEEAKGKGWTFIGEAPSPTVTTGPPEGMLLGGKPLPYWRKVGEIVVSAPPGSLEWQKVVNAELEKYRERAQVAFMRWAT